MTTWEYVSEISTQHQQEEYIPPEDYFSESNLERLKEINYLGKGEIYHYFEDGEEKVEQLHIWKGGRVRRTKKIGRNDPCPCGSGKKFKKCCLNK